MALSPEEYAKVLDQVRSLDLGAIRQLDATGEDGTPLLELCMDPEEGPDVQLERVELRRLLAKALMELPERERQILALYYEEEMTMAEIGEVIGVCESRVSQLRSLALSRLRASMRASLARAERRCMSKILSQEEIDALLTSAAEIERERARRRRGPRP